MAFGRALQHCRRRTVLPSISTRWSWSNVIEPPHDDWWRSHSDLEWQAPELPLDDGQVLILDAEDPFPADEWPVYRVD